MKDRILEFLKTENKSSAQFAEEIGVQPSGISHILSGRNNPSLDFIIKMLEKYKFLSTDWLLFGKGTMYKEQQTPSYNKPSLTLFDLPEIKEEIKIPETHDITKENRPLSRNETNDYTEKVIKNKEVAIKKIIWFYDNNEFEEFHPQ